MASTEFQQLETYLFCKDKNEFVKKLIQNTDSFYYFTLLHALQLHGANLTEEHKRQLESYKKFSNRNSKSILLKHLLLKFDASKNENEIRKSYRNIKIDDSQHRKIN